MLISNEYKDLNRQLHESRPDYGLTVRNYCDPILKLARVNNTTNILDYGCGKGELKKWFDNQGLYYYNIQEYDPGIEGKDGLPEESDISVVVDVFEHIEESCIDEVLDHIKSLTRMCLFATVSLVPAKKFLADGRNAHILLKSSRWWFNKISDRFDINVFNKNDNFIFVLANIKKD